jgi:hypothetical protein
MNEASLAWFDLARHSLRFCKQGDACKHRSVGAAASIDTDQVARAEPDG